MDETSKGSDFIPLKRKSSPKRRKLITYEDSPPRGSRIIIDYNISLSDYRKIREEQKDREERIKRLDTVLKSRIQEVKSLDPPNQHREKRKHSESLERANPKDIIIIKKRSFDVALTRKVSFGRTYTTYCYNYALNSIKKDVIEHEIDCALDINYILSKILLESNKPVIRSLIDDFNKAGSMLSFNKLFTALSLSDDISCTRCVVYSFVSCNCFIGHYISSLTKYFKESAQDGIRSRYMVEFLNSWRNDIALSKANIELLTDTDKSHLTAMEKKKAIPLSFG
jgi:hypothetical protein